MLIPSLESISEKYFIYIILTDTNTTFSRLSKIVTKQPYNHVSLSFTRDLSEMYSYSIYPSAYNKKLFGGFIKEHKTDYPNTKYLLYSVAVTKTQHKKIKNAVDDLLKRMEETSYNIRLLIDIILNRKVDNNVYALNKLICSTFVVEVFKIANIELLDLSGYVIKPYDLVNSKYLNLIESGTF
jgi:hypothetical protein